MFFHSIKVILHHLIRNNLPLKLLKHGHSRMGKDQILYCQYFQNLVFLFHILSFSNAHRKVQDYSFYFSFINLYLKLVLLMFRNYSCNYLEKIREQNMTFIFIQMGNYFHMALKLIQLHNSNLYIQYIFCSVHF